MAAPTMPMNGKIPQYSYSKALKMHNPKSKLELVQIDKGSINPAPMPNSYNQVVKGGKSNKKASGNGDNMSVKQPFGPNY